MKTRIILLVLIILFLSIACSEPPGITEITTSEDEINVMLDPVQTSTNAPPFIMKAGGYDWTITPRAEYTIQAEVKSVRTYGSGWTSILSPVDFALAWQELTKAETGDYITYSQRNRWYYYHYSSQSPYGKSYIIKHSANHHILPATENVKRAVLTIKKGDRIRFLGFLVNVDGIDESGRKVWWHTFLSRSDEGNGSCEVFWVTEMQKGNKIYR